MEHRAASRVRTVLKADIRYNDGLMSMPCVVRDISDTGARLEVSGDVVLPERFELFIEKRHETRRAHLKWRHGREIGVAFDDAGAAKERSAGDADRPLAERVARLETEVADLKRLLRRLVASMPPRS